MGGRGSGFGGGSKSDGSNTLPGGPVVVIESRGLITSLNADSNQKVKSINFFVDYLNNSPADNNTRELYNSLPILIERLKKDKIEFSTVFTNAKKADYAVGVARSRTTGEIKSLKLTIPRLENSDYSDKMNTTAHELGHLIDIILGKNGRMYSEKYIPLNDEINKEFKGHSDSTQKFFDEAREKPKKIRDNYLLKLNKEKQLIEEKHSEKYGELIDQNVFERNELNKKLNDLYTKINKELVNEISLNKTIQSGNALQDIYDALSLGKYFDRGIVVAGHGSQYFNRPGNKEAEIFTNFLQLSIESPEIISYLDNDYPDLVKVLNEMKEEMIGEI